MIEKTKELLIVHTDGRKVLVKNVPEDAKVTFSTVNPAADRTFRPGYCVRIYKTENHQLGVFTNVESFRDLSLKVFEQAVREVHESETERGPNKKTAKVESAVVSAWEEVAL